MKNLSSICAGRNNPRYKNRKQYKPVKKSEPQPTEVRAKVICRILPEVVAKNFDAFIVLPDAVLPKDIKSAATRVRQLILKK